MDDGRLVFESIARDRGIISAVSPAIFRAWFPVEAPSEVIRENGADYLVEG
jgi:hypothetical protein